MPYVDDNRLPDLRAHGSYITSWGCFVFLGRLTPDEAYAFYRAAVPQPECKYKAASPEQFKQNYQNKSWRVVLERAGKVYAIYNHDGHYRMYEAVKTEFLSMWSTKTESITNDRDPYKLMPWVGAKREG